MATQTENVLIGIRNAIETDLRAAAAKTIAEDRAEFNQRLRKRPLAEQMELRQRYRAYFDARYGPSI